MKKIALLICLLSASLLSSQTNGEDQLGAWYMYFGMNKISDRGSLHTEAQFRYWEVISNFNQLLLRTAYNYHIDDKAIASIGYGYIVTDNTFEEPSGDEDSREHRIFEQFILKNKVGSVLFEHRYRLEQRFIDFGSDNDTRHRARYRLQVTIPLSKQWFINTYDEIFINLQDNVFDQNRLYLALGFKFSSITSIQVGYLKNHFPTAHYDRLQLGIFYNPDLRRKTKVTP